MWWSESVEFFSWIKQKYKCTDFKWLNISLLNNDVNIVDIGSMHDKKKIIITFYSHWTKVSSLSKSVLSFQLKLIISKQYNQVTTWLIFIKLIPISCRHVQSFIVHLVMTLFMLNLNFLTWLIFLEKFSI